MLKNKAIFLEKIDDYQKLDKKILDQQTCLVFSFDFDVYNLLKEKKIDFTIADEYLSEKDHMKIHEYTISFYDWYKKSSNLKSLEFEGTNLLELFDTAELHHLLIREIYKFITLKRILEKFDFTQIYANEHISKMISSIIDDNSIISEIKSTPHDFAIPFEKYSIPISVLGKNIPLTIKKF